MIQSAKKPIVQKYGGSSLSTLDKVRSVAEKIIASRENGTPVVVVVSAMGNTTTELIGRALELNESPPRRELDVLLSSGERMSTALLAMALEEAGCPAISLSGPQSGIQTDDNHTNATITDVRPGRVVEELAKGHVVIVAGFQGQCASGDVTTLGRGGSDTTAVALAGALDAERCEIYSDVPGVFTADPRIVENPRRLASIDAELMGEYALHGARVLHPRCIEHAHEEGVTVHACSTFGEELTTEIGSEDGVRFCERSDHDGVVVGVTSRKHRVRVEVKEESKEVLACIEACVDDTEALLRSRRDEAQRLLLDLEDVPDPEAVVERLREELGDRAVIEAKLASVTAVISGGDTNALADRSAAALRAAGLDVEEHYRGENSVTFAIPSGRRADAVRALHEKLIEEHKTEVTA